MTAKAVPVQRGCGTRVPGGCYAEVGMSRDGLPLEAFLVDPPAAWDRARFPLPSVGVTLVHDAASGVYHIFDVVGRQHYPNVCDVLEEGRQFGFSRRIGTGAKFELLSARSRLVLLHERAYLGNWRDYARLWDRPCVKETARRNLLVRGHDPDALTPPITVPLTHQLAPPDHATMCASLWWETVEGGQPIEAPLVPRAVVVSLPSCSYVARALPEDAPAPAWGLAIVASLPISRLAVVRNPSDPEQHERALEKARRAALVVDLEDE